MIAFDNLTPEQRSHLSAIRLIWAMYCNCECGACRAMFNELQRICGDRVESQQQSGAAAAREAHNLEVGGSNPPSAI